MNKNQQILVYETMKKVRMAALLVLLAVGAIVCGIYNFDLFILTISVLFITIFLLLVLTAIVYGICQEIFYWHYDYNIRGILTSSEYSLYKSNLKTYQTLKFGDRNFHNLDDPEKESIVEMKKNLSDEQISIYRKIQGVKIPMYLSSNFVYMFKILFPSKIN